MLLAASLAELAGCLSDQLHTQGSGPGGIAAPEGVPELKLPGCELRQGAVIRGPRDRRRIALVFTAHEFGEGGEIILNELERHKAKASFFLTGDFVRTRAFAGLLERLRKSEHQIGPHSDKHLLYCSWERERRTLVTEAEFESDLKRNISVLRKKFPGRSIRYLLPPYEHYNAEIADWAVSLHLTLINFSPGTRSTADYTGEADRNFASSKDILASIINAERQDPDGLNGFILLLHLGAGPRRADKFHRRFGELLEYLAGKGYEFVTVEELLPGPISLGKCLPQTR